MTKRIIVTLMMCLFCVCIGCSGQWKSAKAVAVLGYGAVGENRWRVDSSGTLAFTGSGTFESYSKGEVPWEALKDDIEHVIFEVSEVKAGVLDYYFSDCPNLQSVNQIPKGVTSLKGTFENCKKLETVDGIPDTVTNMTETFLECRKLNCEIIVPARVEKATAAFKNCYGLTYTPKIQTDILQDLTEMFYNTKMVLPPSLPSKAKNLTRTFYGCSAMSEAPVIPGTVQVMVGTFHRCYAMMQPPVIPENVKDMSYCFYECIFMTATPMIAAKNLESMAYAFYECSSMLGAPVIPDSVTDMTYTFWKCNDMENAPDIPARVKKMSGCLGHCYTASGTMTIYAVIPEEENYTKFSSGSAIYNNTEKYYLGGQGSGLTVNYVNNNKDYALEYLAEGWNCGSFRVYGEVGKLKLGTKVKQRLSDCDVVVPKGLVYTGYDIKPTLNITYAGIPLVKDKDYYYEYANCKNAGTASVYLEGKGEYKGVLNVNYTIERATFNKANAYDYQGIYDGEAHGITVVSDVGAKVEYGLQEGQYTTQTCPTFTMPGTYTVYVQISKENHQTWQGKAQVRIEEGELTVESLGFSGDYDGHPHSISVTADEGAQIMYGMGEGEYPLSTCPFYTSVGRYTIYYKVTKTGYKTAYGKRMVIIKKKQIESVTFPTVSNLYVGNPLRLSSLEFSANLYGSFSWEKPGEIPPVGISNQVLIFTPKDSFNYDFSLVDGYRDSDGLIARTVLIQVLNQPERTPTPVPTPSQSPGTTVKPGETGLPSGGGTSETGSVETSEITEPNTDADSSNESTNHSGENQSNEPSGNQGWNPAENGGSTGEESNGDSQGNAQESAEEMPLATGLSSFFQNLIVKQNKTLLGPKSTNSVGRVKKLNVKRNKGKLKIKWKKVSGVKGYQVWVSTKKKAKKPMKQKNIRKTSIRIKWNKKKRVCVKVRAYTGTGTKRVYGAWSKKCILG